VIETYPELRQALLRKLVLNFNHIKSSKVYRAALWIIGEYSLDAEGFLFFFCLVILKYQPLYFIDIDVAFSTLKGSLGDVPFVEQTSEEEATTEVKPTTTNVSSTRVLPDGTYATQSALVLDTKPGSSKPDPRLATSLRGMLLNGDFFLAAVIASTFCKFIFKLRSLPIKAHVKNAFSAEILLILTSILRLGKSPQFKIDSDSYER